MKYDTIAMMRDEVIAFMIDQGLDAVESAKTVGSLTLGMLWKFNADVIAYQRANC